MVKGLPAGGALTAVLPVLDWGVQGVGEMGEFIKGSARSKVGAALTKAGYCAWPGCAKPMA